MLQINKSGFGGKPNTEDLAARYEKLKQDNQPISIKDVPKDLDEFILEKNKKETLKFQLGISSGLMLLGSGLTELFVLKAKKQLAKESKELSFKVKSLRKMHLAIPLTLGIIAPFAYMETQSRKKEGVISKEAIYKSQGFMVKNESPVNPVIISKTECLLMGIGASLVGIKALSKGKLPVPILRMDLFEKNKLANTICDAIGNGLCLSGIYTMIKTLTPDKIFKNSNQN